MSTRLARSTSFPSRLRVRLGRRGGAIGCTCAAVGVALALGACGSSGGSSVKQSSASAKQTLVFAVDGGTSGGVGSEGQASADEIKSFEKAHPNISVKVLPLSSTTDQARQQVQQYLLSGSSTPDVMDTDSSWPAAFGRAGWVLPLNNVVNQSAFMPGAVAGTSYQGKMYAAMWYYNTEGLYYRTDLVKTPPKTPQQLVSDAMQAMGKDKTLREGLAFEGSKYEGLVTVFIDMAAAFGGKIDPSNMNTPQNLAALEYMHNLVYKYKVSPQAVTGWTEQNVQDALTSGQAVFATNWPYLLSAANSKGSTVNGKVSFAPFPTTNGLGTATLAGDALAINARSQHKAAAEELVRWMLAAPQQDQRAIVSGDPPSITSAYNSALYAKAPYFRIDQKVFTRANPRLEVPQYQQISADLQDMLSSVLANQQSPAQALKSTSKQLTSLTA